MRIHILKHACIGTAEEVFSQIATEAGHEVCVVDPRSVTLEIQSQHPHAVLARCELDDFGEPIFADYLAALHLYERHHIPVMNRAAFLLVGQDKYLSHLAMERRLQNHPLEQCSTPETIRVSYSKDARARAVPFFHRYGGVVVKPPCSGRGKGIFFVETSGRLDQALASYGAEDPVLLQQPILKERSTTGCLRDIRLWVIRDPLTLQAWVVDAYYRVGEPGSFLTNVSKGASVELMPRIDPVLCRFASVILETLGGDVAGVDIARDVHGQYWFEEVNVAFETGAASLALLGDGIWGETLKRLEALCESNNDLLPGWSR